MSSNLSLICRSRRVLPLLKFQQIYAKRKRGLKLEGGVMSSEYGTCLHEVIPTKFRKPFCYQTLLPVSHNIRAVSSNVYITVLVLTDQVLVI